MSLDKYELEKAKLRTWVQRDFADRFCLYEKRCMVKESGRPLFFSHVDLCLNFWGKKLPSLALEDLTACYVYLVAGTYCVDDALDCGSGESIDGQSKDELISLAFDFWRVSYERLESYCARMFTQLERRPLELFHTYIGYNMRAFGEERLYSRSEATAFDHSREYFCTWARSCPFVFLLKSTQVGTSCEVTKEFFEQVELMLYFLQLGDDAGDWKEDFLSSRWTPFLRRNLDQLDFSSLSSLEESLYLGDALEREYSSILMGLMEITKTIGQEKNVEASHLIEFIDLQISKIQFLLEGLVDTKKEFGIVLE